MNVDPALKAMVEEENVLQQAASMLFGEKFTKKATDRVEAVKAIKKGKMSVVFLDTTPRTSRTAAGVVSEVAAGDFSLTSQRQQLVPDQATKDRKTIRNFACTLFSKKLFANLLCRLK